jgi:LysM repeat protein
MKYIRPHLSPDLRAQITPVNRRDRRFAAVGVFFLILSALLAINLFPKQSPAISYNRQDLAQVQSNAQTQDKQILGLATKQEPAEQFTSYSVKNGDTLFNISQQYNIKWDLIAEINGLKEPYVLHAGQTLKIPQATTSKVKDKIYTIASGDTLVSIAKQFNITVDDIIAVNPNLQKSDLITVGQVIKLP